MNKWQQFKKTMALFTWIIFHGMVMMGGGCIFISFLIFPEDWQAPIRIICCIGWVFLYDALVIEPLAKKIFFRILRNGKESKSGQN